MLRKLKKLFVRKNISEVEIKKMEQEIVQSEKKYEDFLNKIKTGEIKIDEEKWEAIKKEMGYKGIFEEDF